MKARILLLSSFLFAVTLLSAQEDTLSVPTSPSSAAQQSSHIELPSKAEADSAYTHERYAESAAIYQQLTDSLGESAQLYFNLGNCYYRQDSIARAILYYERARLLDPSDDDIRFNLEMARAKTVDKVMPASEMFFVSAFRSLVLSLSITEWAILAIAMFVLALIAFCVYFFAPHLTAKKVGFTVALIALLVCVLANIAAFKQRSHIEHRTGAVIMSPSAVVKSTPSTSGTDLFILHEGTHVDIIDNTMHDWVEIHMSDGKEGWLSRDNIEII